jgi:hypothetical protein
MDSVPTPLSLLTMIAAGWSSRYRLIVIEFLQAEPVADRAGLVKVNVARAASGHCQVNLAVAYDAA